MNFPSVGLTRGIKDPSTGNRLIHIQKLCLELPCFSFKFVVAKIKVIEIN
jgi:hypothetical protein